MVLSLQWFEIYFWLACHFLLEHTVANVCFSKAWPSILPWTWRNINTLMFCQLILFFSVTLFCSVLHTASYPTGNVSEAAHRTCLILLTFSDCVYFLIFLCFFHLVELSRMTAISCDLGAAGTRRRRAWWNFGVIHVPWWIIYRKLSCCVPPHPVCPWHL